jgi:Ricin-type beta-trefoil lectin domain-like
VRARRRTAPRRLYRFAVAMAVAVVGIGAAIAGPGVVDAWFGTGGPQPIDHVPADNPELGMVYAGLQPAKKGQPCVGGYQVTERGQCSHGPDAPPAGLNVRKPVTAVAPAIEAPVLARDTTTGPRESDVVADAGGFTVDGGVALVPDAASGTAAVTVGASGVACDGDGVSGKRVQVMYVRDASTTSRYGQFLNSFRTWAAGVDTIYNASAQETGGSRHVRFVTTPDCNVDVPEVEVPAGAMATFNATITALRNLGFNRTDRKYMIFGESTVYCGIGTFAGDERPDAANRSNGGPSYGRSDSGCWAASVAAHELGHNLGAVNNSAPNSSKAGHCLDEYDVMCYNDSGGLKTTVVCSDRAHDQRLDCNHDDYYNTNPTAGSYLSSHWNVANNQFLVDGGGGPTPTPTPSPTSSPPTSRSPSASPSRTTPSPTASPTASPTGSPSPSPTRSSTPSPTATPGPDTGLRELRVSDTTANSTRLAWDAAAAGTRYAIVVDGRSIGQVRSTAVRIVGMRPDTTYQIGVSTVGTSGLTPYTKTVAVHTATAPAPTAGVWTFWRNGLTGGVADVFGARAAAGTPIVLYRWHGGANQQWKLEAAPDGGFVLRSKASNLCLTPLGGRDVAGTPLVQDSCAGAARWTVTETARGVALTTSSGLVVGVSSNRYFGSRLLALQSPTGARYQSWAARAV